MLPISTTYDLRALSVSENLASGSMHDDDARQSLDAPDAIPTGSVEAFHGFAITHTFRREF